MYRICICTLLAVVVSLPAYSQTGNGAPSGSHYNLNIIGVDKGKNPTLTSSDRHTIFVALGSKNNAVQTNIYLTQGPFQVCDGNGFDQAYDCNGNPISINGTNQLGAVFQLPCDTATVGGTTTGTCPSGTSQPYSVWAEALGTPGGKATITTCAYDLTTLVCSTDNAVLVRGSSKPKFTNVTTDLTTLSCTTGTAGCPCLTGTSCTYEIFDTNFEQFFWDYDNQGLRLAQVRFYPQ